MATSNDVDNIVDDDVDGDVDGNIRWRYQVVTSVGDVE